MRRAAESQRRGRDLGVIWRATTDAAAPESNVNVPSIPAVELRSFVYASDRIPGVRRMERELARWH